MHTTCPPRRSFVASDALRRGQVCTEAFHTEIRIRPLRQVFLQRSTVQIADSIVARIFICDSDLAKLEAIQAPVVIPRKPAVLRTYSRRFGGQITPYDLLSMFQHVICVSVLGTEWEVVEIVGLPCTVYRTAGPRFRGDARQYSAILIDAVHSATLDSYSAIAI